MSIKDYLNKYRGARSAPETGWEKFWRFIWETVFNPRVSNYNDAAKIAELKKLYAQVVDDYESSVFSDMEWYGLIASLVRTAIEQSDATVNGELVEPYVDTAINLAVDEGFFGIEEIEWKPDFSLTEQLEAKEFLLNAQKIYRQGEPYLDLWIETLLAAFTTVLERMPNIESEALDEGSFDVSVMHLIDAPKPVLEQIILCFFQKEISDRGMFQSIQSIFNYNARIASGIDPDDETGSGKKLIHPTDSKLEGDALLSTYMRGTGFDDICRSPYPMDIPIALRIEHTHILAGTGHGKTQLIQKLILDDLKAGRGFCAIDSQGDLIRNISMLAKFDPQIEDSLADKLIIVDPTDTDFPACLNMFAMSKGLGESQTSLQKELILNATVDLYSYMFGALFGAELTSKQGTVFAYIARLMVEIPDANIQTLRELMEDGERFIPHMEKLEGSARAFFKTQFFSTSFGQSKKQVLTRLWAVLANATLERMFSNTENKVDVSRAVNEGKIVLINTSKDLLQKDGSAILGRFFIALLSQAVIKRSAIPENERNPYMVYIDEAHEYFDYRLEDILNQARKYKVGFALAHQNLGQLHELKPTVASSTSVKMVGGVSAADAQMMAREMRSSAERVLEVRKYDDGAEFATFMKNLTHKALPLRVQFGLLENEAAMSAESFEILTEGNRNRYCNHISDINLGSEDDEPFSFGKASPKKERKKSVENDTSTAPPKKTKPAPDLAEKEFAEEKPPAPKQTPKNKAVDAPKEGKGGIQHRYLQNLVRKLAHQRGFKAVSEKQVLSGAGSVDVYLEGCDKKIAVEISVSTDWKWEASNVSKCLASGADEVVLLSSDSKHLQNLKENLSNEFSNNENLYFYTSENLVAHLDKLRADSASQEKTVKGYKVKVKYASTPQDEGQAKKDAVASVLVKSLK